MCVDVHVCVQAKGALGGVKAVLVYKDEDELDTGMQKVQPLPFLGMNYREFMKCLCNRK